MKALILSTEFPPGPGGLGTHAWELARHLVKRGWEITVVTSQDYASSEEINNFNKLQPFPVIRMSSYPFLPVRMMNRWRTVSACLKHNPPQTIIGSGSRAVWLAAALSIKFKLPWIAIGHGSEFGYKKFMTRRAFEKATGIICVSNFTMQQMLESGIHSVKCRVIPNGADPDTFRILPRHEVEMFRTSLGFVAKHLILTVGNVTDRKGQEVVIRSLPDVIKEIPDVHYLIVGLPTKRNQLEEIAQQLGVLERVHFLGRVQSEDLVRVINVCDIFVMTSRKTVDADFEGYGIAVVEAALCGKPAIVSGNSGLSEAVIDNETAFVVAENDEKATAKAIVQMLKDIELRQKMGENARRHAIAEQTWSHRIAHYDQFLREVVESEESELKDFVAAR